jgi:hypothetical protein
MSIRQMLFFCIFDRFILFYMKSKAKLSHYNMIIYDLKASKVYLFRVALFIYITI